MKWLASASMCVLSLALSLSPAQSKAAFVVTIEQSGANVLATGTGTLDTTDLSILGSGGTASSIFANLASVNLGPTSSTSTSFSGISGPASFGPGGFFYASSGSGDSVGIQGVGLLITPVGYVSGTPLSDTAMFDDTTIAGLGLTPGSYVYTWGSGAHADSFTVDIIASAAVPEPNSLALMLTGGTVVLAARRWQCRSRSRA